MSDYTILHRPRISYAGFRRILLAAGSPAARESLACWRAFVVAGVDPAVALAMFRKESSFGRAGRAVRTRSWGNLRRSPNYPTVDGFVVYPSWTAGAIDCARLLRVYGQNLIRPGTDTSTVQRLPFVWAPTADGNAPDAYGDSLAAWITAWARAYPPASPTPPARFYTVRAGDSLSSIARRFGTTWQLLYSLNRAAVGPNPNLIHPGLVLRLPAR